MKFTTIYGVDFSGAKEAGKTIWIARATPRGRRLRLVDLRSLESICGASDRETALGRLVELIGSSRQALWGIDFPFGLPIEVVGAGDTWSDQLRTVTTWAEGASRYGVHCLERAKALGGKWHLRRTTDTDARTPFDCYHYRIIYQTFHGMRDVLEPLSRRRRVAILPFEYSKLATANVAVVESCPGSTLKRLGMPHQNYKQPTGGPLTSIRRRTRQTIFDALSRHIEFTDAHRRTMMRNPGGDALDAVIAAVGTIQGWRSSDHVAIRRHDRYPREGRLYY